MFYKNIVRIERWGDTPSHYCNIILALLETIVIFTFIDLSLLHFYKGNYIGYTPLIPFITAIFIYFINKKFYKKREKRIIREILKKRKKIKYLIYLVSISVILVIFLIFFLKGNLIRENNLNL